jgi:hypothetical protein
VIVAAEAYAAAKYAADLLQRHGLDLEVTKGKSKFCLLAAILYGDINKNLYQYCRKEKDRLDRLAVEALDLSETKGATPIPEPP